MSIQSRFSQTGFLAVFTTAVSSSLVLPAISHADMSEADYQAALKLAQQKVIRQKSFNSQSVNALSSSLIRNLFGRMYQVGDQWDVAAWTFSNTMARMTTDPDQLQTKGGSGGIFRYEVLSVKPAPEPEVVLQVTQLEEFGIKKADDRVRNLKLTMNDRMVQSRKTYEIVDRAGRAHTVAVAPEGVHSAITSLELFPLDVPELVTAGSAQAQALPTLPAGLQGVATQAGYRPDAAHSLSFEQDDFFGRGIQVMWQQGDPWPAYFKNSNGVSILIRKGAT